MVNIKEVIDEQVAFQILEHETKGGALGIHVFQIEENYLQELPNEYTAHLVTARQTLEKENFQFNIHVNKLALPNQRKDFPFAETDFDKLDASGQKIDVKNSSGLTST